MEDNALKEEAIRAIRAGFSDQLRGVTFRCTAPIYWYVRHDNRIGAPLKNGTVFFVDAGRGPFAMSARHVLEGYREAMTEHGQDLRCQIGDALFEPIERLIGESKESDIATFSITPQEFAEMDKSPHLVSGPWPPRLPERDKGVFFGGFRGHDRLMEETRINWGFAWGLDTATAIGDDYLSIQFEREHWVCEDLYDAPEPHQEWGGVSGGPVFALVEAGVVSWRLTGVLTEFSTEYEIFRASGLARVRDDGSIK